MTVVCASWLLGVISGCASQGPLRPPSLHLPAQITGLTVQRVGEGVDLHWTTPTKTTDGVGLAGKHGAGALTAEICRSEAIAPDPCPASAKVSVAAGSPAGFHDALPSQLLSGNLRPLHYRVRVVNGAGRGARYVGADTLAGTAPPAVRGLTAGPAANGVALSWQPDPAAIGARTVLNVERVRPADAGFPSPPGGSQRHSDLLAVERSEHDPGGAIDAGARQGIEQRYTVFRTRMFQYGDKILTASSLPGTITVSAAAKAPPPQPPAALEALVNTLGAPEIDLVWQPADGAAGYLVFRAEGDGAPVQLTPLPIPGLSYVDTGVHVGARYRYSVASVDAAGTTGAMSTSVSENIPRP